MPVLIVALAIGLLGRVPDVLKNRWLPVVVAIAGGGLPRGSDWPCATTSAGTLASSWTWPVAPRGAPVLTDAEYDYLSHSSQQHPAPRHRPSRGLGRCGARVGSRRCAHHPHRRVRRRHAVCRSPPCRARGRPWSRPCHAARRPSARRRQPVGERAVHRLLRDAVRRGRCRPRVPPLGGAEAGARGSCWVRLAVAAISVAYVIKTTPAVIIVALVVVALVRLTDRWSIGRAKAAHLFGRRGRPALRRPERRADGGCRVGDRHRHAARSTRLPHRP